VAARTGVDQAGGAAEVIASTNTVIREWAEPLANFELSLEQLPASTNGAPWIANDDPAR
jgi:hypothetical protein